NGKNTDETAKTITINVGFQAPVDETPTNTPPQEATETVEEINDSLANIVVVEGETVSEETDNKVNDDSERSNKLVEQIVSAELPQGAAGVTTAMTALETLSKTLTVTGNVIQGGGNIQTEAAVNSLNNVATVMTALATRTENITPQQKAEVQTLATTTVTSSAKLIKESNSLSELVDVVAATSAVINAAAAVGGEVSQELITQAEQLVTKAVKTGIKAFAENIDVDDPQQVAELLSTNREALEFAIDASVAVKSRAKADSNEINQELSSRGLDASVGDSLKTVLAEVNNPDGINLGDTTATQVLLNALVQFLTGG